MCFSGSNVLLCGSVCIVLNCEQTTVTVTRDTILARPTQLRANFHLHRDRVANKQVFWRDLRVVDPLKKGFVANGDFYCIVLQKVLQVQGVQSLRRLVEPLQFVSQDRHLIPSDIYCRIIVCCLEQCNGHCDCSGQRGVDSGQANY